MNLFKFKQQRWIHYWLHKYSSGIINADEFQRQIYKECQLHDKNITPHIATEIAQNLIIEFSSETHMPASCQQ